MDDFFCIIIEAMVIVLYICVASCYTINNLQTQIGRSNGFTLINKAKCKYLKVFKVYDIQDITSQKTTTIVASMLEIKKKV